MSVKQNAKQTQKTNEAQVDKTKNIFKFSIVNIPIEVLGIVEY